jgi:hypothetical protein
MTLSLSLACRSREAPLVDAAAAPPAPAITPATPSPLALHRVGEWVRATHYEIRVSAPEDCTKAARGTPADPTRRVGVEVTLVRVGDVAVPANPYYARLVDSAGNAYEATLGGCGAGLEPTLPARGETAHGYIVFDVPRSAEGFTFAYAPDVLGGPAEEIEVPLGS